MAWCLYHAGDVRDQEEPALKPAPFEYHAPTTVDEAVALLRAHGDDAKPLAGGQSLVPLLALRLTRFEHLVDLNRIEALQAIERRDGHVVVGAMARQAAAERSEAVAAAVPLLATAIPYIGHFQIRNRGTVGGSIAHADPASELPAVALALDAEMQLDGGRGPARSRPPSSSSPPGPPPSGVTSFWSAPASRVGRTPGVAVDEFARRAGDFAVAGVAAAVAVGGDGKVDQGRDRPVRNGRHAGAGPSGRDRPGRAGPPDAAELQEIGRLAVADADPSADLHASAAYRNRVGAYLVTRALTRALEEASRG